MYTQIPSLIEALLGEGTSVVTISASVPHGDNKLSVTKMIAGLLSSPNNIAPYLKAGLSRVLGALQNQVQTELAASIGIVDTKLELDLRATVTIGDAEAEIQAVLEDGGFPLAQIAAAFKQVAEQFSQDVSRAIQQHAREHNMYWDHEARGYRTFPTAFPGGGSVRVEDLRYAGGSGNLEDILGLFGGRFGGAARRPFTASDGSDIGSLLDLLNSRGAGVILLRRHGASTSPDGTEWSEGNLPDGHYLCPDCKVPHAIEPTVRILLDVLSGAGSLSEGLVKDLPGVVLDGLAKASGGYWNSSTRRVEPIPDGQYPAAGGGLNPLPEGKYWDTHTWALSDVPAAAQ